MKVKIEVEVSKEAHDVGVLVANLVSCLKAKKPLAEIAFAELKDLEAAIDGISQIPAEAKEDMGAFIKALVLPLADIASSLLVSAPQSLASPPPSETQ